MLASIFICSRYQFNPAYYQTTVSMQILLKALMTLPNADFILCRCLIDDANVSLEICNQSSVARNIVGTEVEQVIKKLLTYP